MNPSAPAKAELIEGGRRSVLDAQKRAQIVAILSVGCSQAVAAQFVGCSDSTIRRTAQRDRAFGEEIRRARSNSEWALVKCIRKAAKKEQYWRAAAWALERGFPEKYGRRGPDAITIDQITLLLTKFSEILCEELPDRYRSAVLKRMDALAAAMGIHLKREPTDEPR
jgi:hypothetical protein